MALMLACFQAFLFKKFLPIKLPTSKLLWVTAITLQALCLSNVQAQQIDQSYQRLSIESRPGEMARTYLQDNGQRLFILLTDYADIAQWREKASVIQQSNSLFQSATIQVLDGRAHLIVDFARPVYLVDETLAMSVPGVVSWEMVFSHRIQAISSAELIDSVEAFSRAGLVELVLTGHHDLLAEIAFEKESHSFSIELPGADVRRLLNEKNLVMPAILGFPAINLTPSGGTLLSFSPITGFDLVDAHTSIDPRTQRSRIHLLLVPDSAAALEEGSAALTLNRFEVADLGHGFHIIMDRAAGSQVNTYYLEAPGRLMIDFLGMPIESIEKVVDSFKPDNRYVSAIRYGKTRMGSARIELLLNPSYSSNLKRDTTPYRDDYDFGSMIAMPESGRDIPLSDFPQDLQGIAGFDEATLRDLPRFDFTVQPSLTIGSVTLDGDFYNVIPDIQLGERYSLISVLDEAVLKDPQFQAARANFRANQELVPQAKADLLPSIAFTYQHSAKSQNVRQSEVLPIGESNVTAYNWSVNLTQPIYRLPSRIGLTQAQLAEEQARLSLLAAEQDLILRVAQSYLAMLASSDEVELAKAEHDAIALQLTQAEIRFSSGLLSRGDLNEARSLAALTRARMLEAYSRLEDAKLGMKEIVGREVDSLHTFSADFRAAPPFPERVENWIAAALEQNLALQAQKLASEIAGQQIRRQSAQHHPTVDLFATAGQQNASSTLTSSQRQSINDVEVGIRVNMPIFSGGRTSSQVREAVARNDQVSQEMELEFRRTERRVRSSYLGVVSSAEMLDALREGVLAQEIRLATRLRGFEAGLESTVAVLDAYQSYYAARRDFLKSRYDYLLNRLSLKQSVGSLGRSDLIELEDLLETL